MTDKQVFLSYAPADRDTARHLVRAVEARGWAISWERYDEPDEIATLALREALRESDCVVVLWSANSVDARTIREEAAAARSRGALVQATLDDADVPMPFVLDEPTPLTDEWSLTTLVQQIARVLHDDADTLSRESGVRAPSPETRLEARVLEIAEEHADAGELGQALAIYEKWIEQKPEDMKAVRRLGDLYLAADREQAAAERYERVAEHYASAGFLVPAIETFRRIVALAPYEERYANRLRELVTAQELHTTGSQRAMSSVQFTLTAPPYAAAGDAFFLDVWAHRADDREAIARRINAPRSAGSEPGQALTARVHVDGLDGDGVEQSLVWSDGLGRASFQLASSRESVSGGRVGAVGIYFLGLQIARIHFLTQIGDETAATEIIPSRHERHTSAIACYAPEDRELVEARVRAFELAASGVDVAIEPMELPEFLDELSRKDTFYLFWSENARACSDVERRWRFAMRLRGLDFIDPVPLDGTPPPPELATLQDGDWQAVPELSRASVRPATPGAAL